MAIIGTRAKASQLNVYESEGHCDGCDQIKRIVVIEGFNGNVGICVDCQFPTMKKINAVAKAINEKDN